MKYFKILILSLVLIFTGCSNNENISKENAKKTVTEQNKEVTTGKKSNDEKKKDDKENPNIVVTDLDGNEISLEKPLDKVIIQGSSSGGPFMTMMYLDKDNFLSKIAAMDDSVKKTEMIFIHV